MFGVLTGASLLWKMLASTMMLGFMLGSCDIPIFQDDGPAQPTEVESTDGGDEPAQDPGGEAQDPPGDGDGANGGTPPAAAAEAEVAVYMGWRDTVAVNAFSNWLGRPVWGHDFLDHRQGWSAVADPRAQLDTWEQWVAESDERRLVLSVPLLIERTAGDFAGGANGAYDQHFAELARNLVDRGLEDTVIRLGWEFNGNTFPWAVDRGQVDDYRRFWRRAVTAMRRVDGAAFAFDWCPNITLDATGLPFADLYPGDDVVDIIGLGFYDYYWNHPDASPEARWRWLRDVDNGLADHRDFATAHDKPISFPEYGLWERGTSVGGGGDDPYFIQQLASWIAGSDIAYHGYNNVNATADHRLSSFPEAQRAYLDAFGG
jgi:hypothetical protein